jgi:hypothetical protein
LSRALPANRNGSWVTSATWRRMLAWSSSARSAPS